MHVRIARFEGAEAEALDKQLEGIRSQMEEGRERMAGGGGDGDAPEGMRAVKRVMIAVDREGGRMASLTFADTEGDMRKVDAWLNSMSPDPGAGQRASVEIYEIGIDQQAGQE
jgi:hypothetical protein